MKRLEKFGVSTIYLRQTHPKSLMLHHAAQNQHRVCNYSAQGQRVAAWSLQRAATSVGPSFDHPFMDPAVSQKCAMRPNVSQAGHELQMQH